MDTKQVAKLIELPPTFLYGWDMKKTAPDLYACLPSVLKTLADDVGTLGEQYSASLNDFEEHCHVGYKAYEHLKSDAAWDTYTKEWLSRYSKLVNGFHKSLIQLLIRDLNARCELLGSTELPMELRSHLQK